MADRRFDPRVTPARGDIAAAHLRGKVEAARFVEGERAEIIAAIAPLYGEASADAMLTTQALRGELFTVYDRTEDGWVWGQLESDGYVGWTPAIGIGPARAAATHTVAALRTFGFPGPSIKLHPAATLPFASRLRILGFDGGFAVTDDALYVPAQHVQPLGWRAGDPVGVAEQFLGTPYLWGGRSSLGIDCSGLVQIALAACGVPCPRDSDMQQAALGAAVPLNDWTPARGDLMFWKGHVALVRNGTSIIHANAFAMAVAIEPLDEAVARIAAAGDPLAAVRRMTPAAPSVARD